MLGLVLVLVVVVVIVGGGDGGPYVVMEHIPKPQQKMRRTHHFSVQVVVQVVVGSVVFVSLSLENLE